MDTPFPPINRFNLALIATPFFLTAILVFFGYQILIRTTPEARITPPAQEAQTEILTQSSFPIVSPQTTLPPDATFFIASLPDNTPALNALIKKAQTAQANGIYLSVSATLNSDHSLKLTHADASSSENILRWAKKTISTAHQNHLHVILALSINSSHTVDDYSVFSTNYLKFILPWASLATEYGVSFFYPGLTIGHPLYSHLTPNQQNQLLRQIQSTIRKKYSGSIGAGFCCQTQTSAKPGGYSFLVAIPTPEFPTAKMLTQLSRFKSTYQLDYVFEYSRQNNRLSSLKLN